MIGSRAQLALLAIAMGLCAACEDPDPRCVVRGGPASLEIGGGTYQTGFVEMQDGDEMALELSAGGLYFLEPSIRAWGVYPGAAGRLGNPEDPEILIELFLQTELIGGSARAHVGLTVTADGAEKLTIHAPFSCALGRSTYIDQLVTIYAEITDVCGNTATDTLHVVVVDR